MALTSVGAFYATVSKLLQRVFIPSVDDSEIVAQPIAAGETLGIYPLSTFQAGGPPAIQALIGAPTFSGRCAVVDGTNTVIDAIIADPVLYSDSRGACIASDKATTGDKWTGSYFTRIFAEYDSTRNIVAVGPYKIENQVPVNAGNKLIAVPVGGAVWATVGGKVPAKGTVVVTG